jgi:nucleotide-binding universal stress UspA family protein
VLVAWNGSREAARAAHDALPFLTRGAGLVVLCAVGERAAAGLDDAAAMLARHGVPVRAERVGGPDANAGEILLARAAAHGADLLVMGAYGHGRLRELVFGGANRDALRAAKLPVLFGG